MLRKDNLVPLVDEPGSVDVEVKLAEVAELQTGR
jgi:hypothetical protein